MVRNYFLPFWVLGYIYIIITIYTYIYIELAEGIHIRSDSWDDPPSYLSHFDIIYIHTQ